MAKALHPVRALVVDDSAFMRKIISDILESDELVKVVDTAKNGKEALEKIMLLKPDVVTLDVEMPVMGGLECLQEIMKRNPLPVIMLSSITKEGADATIRALEYGAIDFITKPSNIFGITGESLRKELVEKIKMAGLKSVRKHVELEKKHVDEKKHVEPEKVRVVPKASPVKSTSIRHIIAIGTSTGGPRALQDVLPLIPGDIPAAIVVVQHMPPGFTRSLAERLNSLSEVTVKEAEHNERLQPGHAYIAPGDYHMQFERALNGEIRIKLSQSEPVGGHRPSVNVMMESLSSLSLTNLIGVIMTGMGNDGREGLKKIKTVNKGYIIAQDEKSSVVYGMPKAAVHAGIVDKIVTLKEITGEIIKKVGEGSQWT